MTYSKYGASIVASVVVIALGVSLFIGVRTLAQGGGGSGSGGSGDQIQDRDRIQDPSTHDGDEPLQDRDQIQDRDRIQDPLINTALEPIQDRTQDRDRLRDPSLHIGDEPIQDQDQLRDRLRDRLREQLQNPDQERDRDRIRANDTAGLQTVITTAEEASDDVTNGLGEEIRVLARNHNRVEVDVMALIAAQNMVGPFGKQVSDLAQNISSSTRMAVRSEEHIQNRSRLARFFFGGDTDAAETIQEQVRNNEQSIERIRQHLNECRCGSEVQTMLETQLRNMEAEQTRLHERADEEMTTWGLLSWRF